MNNDTASEKDFSEIEENYRLLTSLHLNKSDDTNTIETLKNLLGEKFSCMARSRAYQIKYIQEACGKHTLGDFGDKYIVPMIENTVPEKERLSHEHRALTAARFDRLRLVSLVCCAKIESVREAAWWRIIFNREIETAQIERLADYFSLPISLELRRRSPLTGPLSALTPEKLMNGINT